MLSRQLRKYPDSTAEHFNPDLERDEKGVFLCIASALFLIFSKSLPDIQSLWDVVVLTLHLFDVL